MLVTRGFKGKRREGDDARRRLPPGQFLTPEFPVLTAGPTQHTPTDRWSLSLQFGGKLLVFVRERPEAVTGRAHDSR